MQIYQTERFTKELNFLGKKIGGVI